MSEWTITAAGGDMDTLVDAGTLVRLLPARHGLALSCRYGIDGVGPLTFAEIGVLLDVEQTRAASIVREAEMMAHACSRNGASDIWWLTR